MIKIKYLILHPTPTPLFYDMPHRILEKEEPLNRANSSSVVVSDSSSVVVSDSSTIVVSDSSTIVVSDSSLIYPLWYLQTFLKILYC
jgi:hypothetical protein